MTISAAVQAFCNMFEQMVKTQNTAIEKQSESTVNKAVKRTTKAIQAANRGLDVASKYIGYMSKDDKKTFEKAKKEFDNNIGGK